MIPIFILLWALCLSQASKVVVITVATEETDGLKRYLRSASTYGVDVEVIGLGEEWKGGDTRIEAGGGQKIRMLRGAVEKYKDEKDTLIIFTDAYDVVWMGGKDELLRRLSTHFPSLRVLFSAEPFCWPDASLANEYPVVYSGKRFLNSGLFAAYAPELFEILSQKDVQDNDDDQLYYTKVFLDQQLREKLMIGLDSQSQIFQNLNGVIDDVQLTFDDNGEALAYNAAYDTYPLLLHGNGPSKLHLNYLANYVAKEWSASEGCRRCGARKQIQEEDDSSSMLPSLMVAIFTTKPIPFFDEFISSIVEQDYPKEKMHIFVYNSRPLLINTWFNWLGDTGKAYVSRDVYNAVEGIGERDARQLAIEKTLSRGCEMLLTIDADHFLSDKDVLRELVEMSRFYDVSMISPLMSQPGKLFSNFWGAVSNTGYYARSEDYIALIGRKRVGMWNVPFLGGPLLIRSTLLRRLNRPFHYNTNIDPDMSFCLYARDNGMFMYVNNEKEYGFMIVGEDYAEDLEDGHLHPEMWQIFFNKQLWESRYLHPLYRGILEGPLEDVPQPCPDVFDYPLMSERFCKEIIEEMEHFGQWSDGSNKDNRLAGGYENVPTRDIHMNQIGFARQWLYFMDQYVRPMQEKVFTGYYHAPVESNMMFVVRYKPTEQASLRPHHDASTFSIDIALNKKDKDYAGGGVRFDRYNCTVAADEVGHTMMFPGRLTHLHEGLPTTEGTRYILVSFINP